MAARVATIPLLHDGAYRRRLVVLQMPLTFAFLTAVTTTKIAPTPALVAGVPVVVLGALAGVVASGGMEEHIFQQHQRILVQEMVMRWF